MFPPPALRHRRNENDHVHHPCLYINRPASLVMYVLAWWWAESTRVWTATLARFDEALRSVWSQGRDARGGSSAGQSSGLIIRQVVGSSPTRPTNAETINTAVNCADALTAAVAAGAPSASSRCPDPGRRPGPRRWPSWGTRTRVRCARRRRTGTTLRRPRPTAARSDAGRRGIERPDAADVCHLDLVMGGTTRCVPGTGAWVS